MRCLFGIFIVFIPYSVFADDINLGVDISGTLGSSCTVEHIIDSGNGYLGIVVSEVPRNVSSWVIASKLVDGSLACTDKSLDTISCKVNELPHYRIYCDHFTRGTISYGGSETHTSGSGKKQLTITVLSPVDNSGNALNGNIAINSQTSLDVYITAKFELPSLSNPNQYEYWQNSVQNALTIDF